VRARVTGAGGFIGKRLCQALEERGWHHSVDSPDVIFHLAALTRNDRSIADPVQTISSNVGLSARIFEDARLSEIPVVYTSSAVIFSPIRTPYQISKIAADELAQWYNANGGDIRIVRLADVYGPGMTSGPIAAWREQYRKNGAIDVWDGPQKRHYSYIDDAVRALISMVTEPKCIVNVGETRSFDIKDVASLLKVPIRIVPAPRPVAKSVPLPLEDRWMSGPTSLGEGMEIVRQKEFM
jgi:nucleoside-diphosphate-sugar epimerase